MAVLLINGSPHQNGNTAAALKMVQDGLQQGGVPAELFWLGQQPLGDCIACGACNAQNPPACKGVSDPGEDKVAAFLARAAQYDGFVFGTPVYYANANGRLLSFMNRIFRAGGSLMAYKVAAAVAVARRAGTCTAMSEVEKYFHLFQMPIATSTYWPVIFGRHPGEANFDQEGRATLQGLGLNIAWLIKALASARTQQIVPPPLPPKTMTNFIRADLAAP
jgi:multimeric flavodoxin WrbA